VKAHQAVSGQVCGKEAQVHVREELPIAGACITVELSHKFHLIVSLVVERGMVDVSTNQPLAEVDVFLGVENVSVPKRIDRSRNSVLVARIEDGDRVVLLEGEDALIEVLFDW